MIILSGLLVIGAIALLVAGIVTQEQGVLGLTGLQLIYVSIAVSVVSALCLAIGVLIRRKELFGTGQASPAVAKTRPPGRAARQVAKTPLQDDTVAEMPVGAYEEPPAAFPMPAVEVPDDALVLVVPGRKRYHLETCRQLAGRQTEELTYVEALEEGFTPCTACLPDTALAARASVSGGAETAQLEEQRFSSAEELSPPTSPDWIKGAAPAAGATTFDVPSLPDPTPDWAHEPYKPTPLDTPTWEQTPETPSWEKGPETPSWEKTSEVPSWEKAPEVPSWEKAPEAPVGEPMPWQKPSAEVSPLDTVTDGGGFSEAGTWPAEKEDMSSEAVKDEPEAPAVPESREPLGGSSGPLVRILSGTKRYHRPECALIEDIAEEDDDLESLTRDEAKARGCTPCLVCQPDRTPAV